MNVASPMGARAEGAVFWRQPQSPELEGTVLRMTRDLIVFETCSQGCVLMTSEVLHEFKIFVRNRTIYSGRVVVRSVVHAGLVVICEATLDDAEVAVHRDGTAQKPAALEVASRAFLQEWEKTYRILPEYKIAVADLQTFLTELRLWTEQVELGSPASGLGEQLGTNREGAGAIARVAFPTIGALMEKFEHIASTVPLELIPAHQRYVRRQLHPLLLSAPFMHRIYTKPLGYAGDYEMMNMIWRNDYEGNSLFARLLHAFILQQAPALSVRNRVEYMTARLIDEALRMARQGERIRIYSLGCGPAREVEFFLAHPLSDRADFRLIDLDDETLVQTRRRLEMTRQKHQRRATFEFIKKSALALLRTADRGEPGNPGYDVIYSSGLYDYFTDRVCQALNTILYEQLRPGGALIISNFDPSNPIRNIMEFIFEWFLIHRDARQMAETAPDQASPDDYRVKADTTGCNVFLEVRKPSRSS